MFDSTLTITIHAVDITFSRINQDNFSAVYFAEEGTERHTLTIKHTIPADGLPGESHLMRLDTVTFDPITGQLLSSDSIWMVMKTNVGIQRTDDISGHARALSGFANGANIDKVLNRES
jgi:hypothetical protein